MISADAAPRSSVGSAAALAAWLWPLLPVAMAAVVYHAVTETYFFADDFVCMFNIVNRGFWRFVLELFGGHILVLRNVVFYVWYQIFGFHPRPYYTLAVVTHLLNVWLMFRVTRTFTGSSALACLGAAMWGTCPLLIGTIGWYAVYGQIMVATILLVLLDQLGRRMERGELPSPRVTGAWYALLIAGMTCFGVGIGVAVAFPVVLFLLLPGAFRDWRLRLVFGTFPLVALGIYFGFRKVYGLYTPMPFAEVILDSALFSALSPIVSMLWHLIAYGMVGLLFGFRLVPTEYPDQRTRVAVGLFLAGLLVVLVTSDGPTRRRLVALAALCVAAYATIAIGRSNVYAMFKVESFVAARQARYHYVGLIPLVIAICLVVEAVLRRVPRRHEVTAALLVGWLGFTAYAFAGSGWRVDDRSGIRGFVDVGLNRIDMLVRARSPGQDVYIENQPAPRTMMGPMLPDTVFPGLAGLFVITHPDNEARGRRVHFIERDPAILQIAREPGNRRLGTLIVAPDEGAAESRP